MNRRRQNPGLRLHQAGVATPAIDQLLRSRGALEGISARKVQVFVIGGAIALFIFGPVAVFALLVAGVLWGRKLWAQVKPPHTSTADFLRQIAKEAEAATKLRR